MKKYIVVFFILCSFYSLFANEQKTNQIVTDSNISAYTLDFDEPEENEFIRKLNTSSKVEIGMGIMMMSLSVTPIVAFSVLSFVGASSTFFSPLGILGCQMGVTGGLLLYLGVVQNKLAKDYDDNIYKYEMSKVLRNAGIISLGTSALSLLFTAQNVYYLISMSYPIFGAVLAGNLLMVAGQILTGSIFLVKGVQRMNFWLDVMSSFDVSVVHDEKQDFDRGYSVRLGARIRL